MSGTPKRIARLAVAVLFVVPTLLVAAGTSSVAAPTQAEVEAAEAKANEIGHELEVAIEQYNDARLRLQGVQDRLADALDDKRAAEALAAEAMGQLEERAVAAYTGAGSQMDVLLGASDLSEFSDRLEFMGALAQNDADLAAAALNARQQAEWAADRYEKTIEEKQAELEQMEAKRAEIQRMLDEQKALVDQLNREYREYIERQEAQAAAAAAAEAAAADDTGTGGSTDTTGGGGGFVPPPDSSAAGVAIAAAQSVLGAPYVWGSAGPDTFDCSGSRAGPTRRPACTCRIRQRPRLLRSPRCRTARRSRRPALLLLPDQPRVPVPGWRHDDPRAHPGPGGEVQIGSVSGYGTPSSRSPGRPDRPPFTARACR